MDFKFVAINLEYLKEIKNWKYDSCVKEIYLEPYFEDIDKKTGFKEFKKEKDSIEIIKYI
ncbi:MAG: hypothetical protein ACOCV1_05655 [Bacillota bacterium]